jgi:hypothetical protein
LRFSVVVFAIKPDARINSFAAVGYRLISIQPCHLLLNQNDVWISPQGILATKTHTAASGVFAVRAQESN